MLSLVSFSVRTSDRLSRPFEIETKLQKFKCNISKALSQTIDSVSEDDVNTVMASMQGIIDEGSDHIKDLELKIKNQGRVKQSCTFPTEKYS